jgi:hypothetical protein
MKINWLDRDHIVIDDVELFRSTDFTVGQLYTKSAYIIANLESWRVLQTDDSETVVEYNLGDSTTYHVFQTVDSEVYILANKRTAWFARIHAEHINRLGRKFLMEHLDKRVIV